VFDADGLVVGHWRHVRHGGTCHRLFIPRVRCGACRLSHALMPAFLLVGRLDTVETISAVIVEVAGGSGVRPAGRCSLHHGERMVAAVPGTG
jgi:hypothetical protein